MSSLPRPADEPLDPIVEATIEQAMRPYLGVLPPAALQTMRELLVDALTTHPDAVAAVQDWARPYAPQPSEPT